MLNLVLSAEKINDIQICPTLYNYKHELGIVPTTKPYYFEEGELMHEMLKMYYTTRMNKETNYLNPIIEHGRNYAAKNIIGLKAEDVEEAIKDFQMYFEYYSQTESWEILGVEEPFAKELYVDSDLRIVVVGKSDLRVNTRGNIKAVVDHKYEARFYEKHERDNQSLCYCWAYEVRDFIYNRIGKQKTKKVEDKLLRPYISYSDYQINDWKQSVIDSAADILRSLNSGRWPMRIHGCTIRGNKCTFYDVCNTVPDNREYKIDTMFKNRDKFSVMESEK